MDVDHFATRLADLGYRVIPIVGAARRNLDPSAALGELDCGGPSHAGATARDNRHFPIEFTCHRLSPTSLFSANCKADPAPGHTHPARTQRAQHRSATYILITI
jgi:hypothetical protein